MGRFYCRDERTGRDIWQSPEQREREQTEHVQQTGHGQGYLLARGEWKMIENRESIVRLAGQSRVRTAGLCRE